MVTPVTAHSCLSGESRDPSMAGSRSPCVAVRGRRRCVVAVGTAATLAAWTLTANAVAEEDDPGGPASKGPVVALVYDGTLLSDLRGGARTGTTSVHDLHLKVTADGEAMGWPGLTAFADVLTIRGGRPSLRVGDAQGTSNLEGPTGTQLEELWIQQNFAGGSSVLAGIYDLNSEFDRLQGAGLFQNSAFGIGTEFAQSGVEGPSIFPRTSAALRLAVHPSARTVFRAAVLDGVPYVRSDGSHGFFRKGDGLLVIGELAWLTRAASTAGRPPSVRSRIGRFPMLDPYDDKIAVGTWRYSSKVADLSALDASGQAPPRTNAGAYVIGERLLHETGGPNPGRVSGFVQLGYADPRVNRFARYLGAGLSVSGWGVFKPEDQWGLAIARATNGSHYRRLMASQGVSDSETTFEFAYLTQAFRHLALQPDLQYVRHPNTDPSRSAAWIAQLRFEVAF